MGKGKTSSSDTYLKIVYHPELVQKLKDAVWFCKLANFNETEALAFVNSGELGYRKQTADDKKNNIRRPIIVSRATYYKYLRIIAQPEEQAMETFKIIREEYVSTVIERWKLYKRLESQSIRALEMEQDPHKEAAHHKRGCSATRPISPPCWMC